MTPENCYGITTLFKENVVHYRNVAQTKVYSFFSGMDIHQGSMKRKCIDINNFHPDYMHDNAIHRNNLESKLNKRQMPKHI